MNPAVKKRILAEIVYIKENMHLYNATLLDYKLGNKESYVEVITPNSNTLTFTLPFDYPFKGPSLLTFNGENYRKLLNKMPKRVRYLYENPNDIYYNEKCKIKHFSRPDCLCCSNLLCPENWSPACRIYSVLNEINQHNELKSQIKYKLSFNLIIEKFKINPDIVRFVYSFL
uniref:Uncharacterized protein n=1 Tax=viral metagenome TaxID=1070528 RepID=A0A6C0KYR1_9ZZZZ